MTVLNPHGCDDGVGRVWEWQMLIFIMVAVAFGLALPFTGRWLYDAVREKLVWHVVWTGLAFVINLAMFAFLLFVVWGVMNVTV